MLQDVLRKALFSVFFLTCSIARAQIDSSGDIVDIQKSGNQP